MADYRSDNYWQRLVAGRVNRRRLIGGGAVISSVTALGLVGCSSSNNGNNAGKAVATAPAAASAAANKTAPAAAPSAAAAPAVPPAAGLKTGGTLQSYITGTAPLDPVENTTYRAQWAAGFHYTRLLRFAATADPNVSHSHVIVPDAIDKYEVAPDGLTYTMHVRQGVNFHAPLSRPLTSADILASYQYFTTNAKNTNAGVFAPIVDSLTAPDDKTIVFKLKQPYAPFLNKLGNPQYLWIMSKDAVDRKIDPSQQAIGTGPWIFGSSTPTALTWKKNPDYYNKGLPYADGAVLNIIPDSSTQEAQFQAGALDIGGIDAVDIDVMKKAIPKAQVFEYVLNGMSFLFFYNVQAADSPFKDPRVRQAASLALDRDGLIDAAYGGKGIYCNIVNGGLGKWYLDPKGKEIGDAGKWFKHDPQQAKQMLAAAGHANTEFKFIYPNNAYGNVYNNVSDAIRGMLSDAGFKLQVVTVDYLKDWVAPNTGYGIKGLPQNAIGHALQTPFSDPDDFLTGMLTKDGNRNSDLLDDPELAALVKKQQVELDENKRLQLVYDATRLADDKMYYVPGVYPKGYILSQSWLQNVWIADDYNFGTETFPYMSINK